MHHNIWTDYSEQCDHASDYSYLTRLPAWSTYKYMVDRSHGLVSPIDISRQRYALFHLKELYFVQRPTGAVNMTIDGHYYVSLDKDTQTIEGYYCDPNMPDQKVLLHYVYSPTGAPVPSAVLL